MLNNKTRRDVIKILGFLPVLLAISVSGTQLWAAAPSSIDGARRPNVLLILADDMGFADAGCYGGEIQTPVLDSLAARGLRFANFYNTARCWPTRSCILTGYYFEQLGKRKALPRCLQPLGYRSYHFGKTHWQGIDGPIGFDVSRKMLGENAYFHKNGDYDTTVLAKHAIETLNDHAQNHSQQPFLVYMAFHAPHFPLQALQEDIAVYRERYRVGWDVIREQRWKRQREMGLVNCPLSDLETNLKPRYLSPPEAQQPDEVYRAVPWNTLTKEQKEFQATKMAIHAAMIHRMDIEIGRMIEALKANGQFENTLILFLSDNGTDCSLLVRSNRPCGCGPFSKPCPHSHDAPPGSPNSYLSLGPGWSSAGNTPFRMHKIWTHEGGIATPLIVHWPAGLEAHGELRHDLGHVVDIVPTVLDLAGVEVKIEPGAPPFVGKSLVPAFHKDGAVTRDWLYFNHAGNRALRGPRYKVVSANEHGAKTWQVYDMAVDRCEMQDLSEREPEIVKQMADKWKALTAQFAEDASR